jgi:16S rRNA (guanine527-N7)-methyltransferase
VSGGPAGPSQPPPELDAVAAEAMQRVLELLRSERSSVSSVTEPRRAWQVHVADSLTGLQVPELAAAEAIADVGSGNGFPGLALAAALPKARVDLVESVRRKCEFMRRAISAAGIGNARVVCERAETWAGAEPPQGGRGGYDVVSARAVGRLATLAELASPLLRDGGALVAWKGRRSDEEDEEMAAASGRLAMRPEQVLAVGPYAGSRHRHLHVMRKAGPTPEGLPRRPGMAKKRPFGARRGAG